MKGANRPKAALQRGRCKRSFDIHFPPEKSIAVTTTFLGLIHCGIRVLQQRLLIRPSIGVSGYAV